VWGAVNNFWETRYRLLMQQCEMLVNQLSGEEIPKQILAEEQTVRLLTGVVRPSKKRWTHLWPGCSVVSGGYFSRR
jgi:hypothetical protein